MNELRLAGVSLATVACRAWPRLRLSLLPGFAAVFFSMPAQAQLGVFNDVLRNVLNPAAHRCRVLLDWVRLPTSTAEATQPPGGRALPGVRGGWSPRWGYLTSDEVFEPRFGKRYDQLTMQDFREFQRETARVCMQGGQFTPGEWQTVQALWNERQQTSIVQMRRAQEAQLAEAARAQAQADAELRQLTEELGPGLSLDRLRTIRSRAQGLEHAASPQARQGFREAFERELQAQVPDLLRQQINGALSQSPSGDALPALIQLNARVAPQTSGWGVGLVPDDPAVLALQRRIADLDRETAGMERRTLGSFSESLSGLEDGVRWHQRFQSRWAGMLAQLPELTAVETDFRQRRQADLTRHGDGLVRAAQQAVTVSEAQSMVGRFTLVFEQGHPSTRALAAAVDDRVRLIERNQALGRSTPPGAVRSEPQAAVAERVPAATRPLAGSAAGEPSEEVMYDLVRQRFENAAARVRSLYEQCERGGDRSNPMNAMMCLGINLERGFTGGAAAVPTRIVRFGKIGCEKSPSRPGYNCEYEIEADNPMNKQFQTLTGFNIDQSGLGQGRWVRRSDGSWLMITEE